MNISVMPGLGFGKVRFGMRKQEIVELLGFPEHEETFAYEDGMSSRDTQLFYTKMKLCLNLSGDHEDRLISISSKYRNTLYGEKGLVRADLRELECYFRELQLVSIEKTTYSDCEIMSVRELELDMWFEDGRCYMVEWGCFWLSENIVAWPSRAP